MAKRARSKKRRPERVDAPALFDAIPSEVFDGALEGLVNRAGAKLPHALVLRHVVGLAFFRELSGERVLERVGAICGAPASWRGRVPHATSIAQARDRLGFEVVRNAYRLFASYLSTCPEDTERWRGMLLVAMDGTMQDTPDTAANVAVFGRPGGRNGSGGFPKLRIVALVGTASHYVLDCAVGPCKGIGTGETTLALQLLPRLRPDWLLLADRGFCAFPVLKALGNRPFFIRRTQGTTSVKVQKIGQAIQPGRDFWVDYLPSSVRGEDPLRLRLVRIRVRRVGWVEFLTNLDPVEHPYECLRDLYLQRWEVEFAFREAKSDLLGKASFRSKTPRRVLQEVYGLLIAYNAVRGCMARAGQIARVEPRRLSFRRSLQIVRFHTDRRSSAKAAALEIAVHVLPKRKPRSYPRVVKKPASKFAANRSRAEPLEDARKKAG
jgi:hypothetical protein